MEDRTKKEMIQLIALHKERLDKIENKITQELLTKYQVSDFSNISAYAPTGLEEATWQKWIIISLPINAYIYQITLDIKYAVSPIAKIRPNVSINKIEEKYIQGQQSICSNDELIFKSDEINEDEILYNAINAINNFGNGLNIKLTSYNT
ncbi:hypothetical protein K7J14_14995 [Treponema zuelzerae]|uniref:Uncharacterized protein n=1 Tax=Teretinema zuelzerae TaxID=156 RepID=A0AAE3EJQ9_9SPIR|nr:hypothetical protein [Teretinema zuelzerae]MCD1656004.1 hypothetical protein [Teretinema zuelzerae]